MTIAKDDPATPAGTASGTDGRGRATQSRAERRFGRGRGRRAGPQGHAPRGARPQADAHRGGRPVRGDAAPGRRCLLQLPGRRDPPAVRRPGRLPGAAPHPRPPRAGRRPRRRRLRPGHRPRRRVHGDVRPGRDEPRHRHRDRAPGLRADGRDHRERDGRPAGQGRLPGDRHQRHHPADDQAQLPRARCGRHPARHRGGLPHRPDRAARPGPRRHHEGRAPAGDAGPAPHRGGGRRRPAGLPAEPGRPSRSS